MFKYIGYISFQLFLEVRRSKKLKLKGNLARYSKETYNELYIKQEYGQYEMYQTIVEVSTSTL